MLLGAPPPRAPSSPAGAPLQLLTPALRSRLSLRVAAAGAPRSSAPPPPAGAPGRWRTAGSRRPGVDAEAAQVQVQVQGPRGSAASCGPAHPPPPRRRSAQVRRRPRKSTGWGRGAPGRALRRRPAGAGAQPGQAPGGPCTPQEGPAQRAELPERRRLPAGLPEGLPRGTSPPAAGKAPRPSPPPVCSGGPSRPQDARRWVAGLVPGRGRLSGPRRPGRRLSLPAQGGLLMAASSEKPQASPGAPSSRRPRGRGPLPPEDWVRGGQAESAAGRSQEEPWRGLAGGASPPPPGQHQGAERGPGGARSALLSWSQQPGGSASLPLSRRPGHPDTARRRLGPTSNLPMRGPWVEQGHPPPPT